MSQAPSDAIVQYSKVIASENASAGGVNTGVALNVAGSAGLVIENGIPSVQLDDNAGETVEGADMYGMLGVVCRPLPPEIVGNQSRHADALCVRTADGLQPIAYRDPRLAMAGNAPGNGTVALVGYGGGFHSLDYNTDSNGGNRHTIYCPYDFDESGVAQKAHALTLDPTSGNASIALVHAEGFAVTMTDDELTLKNKDGTAWIRLDNNGITLVGKVTVNGSMVIGDPLTSVPLLAGAASPPCSVLFVSP